MSDEVEGPRPTPHGPRGRANFLRSEIRSLFAEDLTATSATIRYPAGWSRTGETPNAKFPALNSRTLRIFFLSLLTPYILYPIKIFHVIVFNIFSLLLQTFRKKEIGLSQPIKKLMKREISHHLKHFSCFFFISPCFCFNFFGVPIFWQEQIFLVQVCHIRFSQELIQPNIGDKSESFFASVSIMI